MDNIRPLIVQIQNPKTRKYILVDREKGIIKSHKKSHGPYKNIKIIGNNNDKNQNR